jgi:chorismate-pyruvate lyase
MIELGLSVLQQKLQESSDTVTHFLEMLTGEALYADVIRQHSVAAGTANDLEVDPDHVVTHRLAVLKGCTSGRPFLYAESIFVPERLSEQMRARLAESRDPIGRVLVAHNVQLEREPLTRPEPLETHAISSEGDLASDVVWSRAYRLMIDSKPAFAIREWFLLSVLQALARQARS